MRFNGRMKKRAHVRLPKQRAAEAVIETPAVPPQHTVESKPASATKKDVARTYQVSTRTVTRWVADGCPHYRVGNGDNCRLVRLDLAQVDRWLRDNFLTIRAA